ncbi:hypothetical protein MNB_SM-7-1205 [hydrothermal vent metagenome]|uniref:Uncharacterized protein n=1 Tax=hydrothermal vent metagenome TaxID=652676 RepID=A0A1W1BEY9_9ZZZZ
MAIGPVGSAIYVNQQTPYVASIKTDLNGRLEIQNFIAQQIANEQEKEIQEVREPEESHAINPDREHQRQEADEELEAQKEAAEKKEKKKEEKSSFTLHKLDIKV